MTWQKRAIRSRLVLDELGPEQDGEALRFIVGVNHDPQRHESRAAAIYNPGLVRIPWPGGSAEKAATTMNARPDCPDWVNAVFESLYAEVD